MTISSGVAAFGGTNEPTENTKFEVTWWHIPGGTDYEHATIVKGYFDDEKDAKAFVSQYERRCPEAMAEMHEFKYIAV